MQTRLADAPIEVIELERSILGAMVLDGIAACEGISNLDVSDFATDSHRRIFSAMLSLHSQGVETDLAILADELKRRGELDSIGGWGFLMDVTSDVPRNARAQEYVYRIQEKAMARRAAGACEDALRRFRDPSESSQEVCDDLSRVLTGERKQNGVLIGDVIGGALKSMEAGDRRVISTGVRELDEFTNGGMRTKELWIIGANPSRGKSSLLRQMEQGAIFAGESVYTHTAEMPKDEWSLLHAAVVAGIPVWKIRSPETMTLVDKDRLMGAAVKIQKWPLILDDESDPSIESIVAKSRLSAMRDGTRVIGVDYIQLVRGEGKELRHQVGNIAKRLKQFAKKHDCCVVALSQLTRKGDMNARPIMQDLKESGDLEAHADVIVMPYRPVDGEGKFTGEDELIVTKQRNGAIGPVAMTYNTHTLRFESRR